MLVIKTLLKILVLPLVFVSWFLWFMARMLTDLSSYVTGPLMLFIFGCGIYTIIKRLWSQALILVLMEAVCCLIIFCASFIIFILEEWSHSLLDFLFS